MWWGAEIETTAETKSTEGQNNIETEHLTETPELVELRTRLPAEPALAQSYPPHPADAIDYRNDFYQVFSSFLSPEGRDAYLNVEALYERDMGDFRLYSTAKVGGDPNTRGRGRTVETQGSGVAVTRAMWEFLRRYEEDDDDE
jgi:hypothetical protein